ncbi:MAG: V-type ATP synthase subunit I [Endomicrobiia bacterium]
MAIDKIKKSIFLVPQDIYEKFILELKKISAVEIIPQQQATSQYLVENKFLDYSYDTIKPLATKFESIVSLCKKYNIKTDIKIDTQTFISQNLKNDLIETEIIFSEIEKIDNEIKSLQNILQQIETKISLLKNFDGINLRFDKLKQLKNIKYYFLKIETKKLENFLKETKETKTLYIWTQKKLKETSFLFILLPNEINTQFLNIVKKFEGQILNLQEEISCLTIEEEINNLKKEFEKKQKSLKEEKEKIIKIFESEIQKIFNLYYQILELQDFLSVEQGVFKTKYIKVVYCWVPQKFINKIKNLLDKFKQINVLFFDPQQDEDIPVVLKNKKSVEPYEFITTLYGYPKIGSVDPTGFLAPFFTIFFALCLSDMFYAILIILLWLFLKNKIEKNSEYYKFIQLFKYLGLTSIIGGLFLDSFLGFSIIKNFKFPLNIVIFDPLNRPIDMLKFTFLLGFIQIISGLLINCIKSFKEKEIFSGIDNLSWVLFITVFAPVVYKLFFPQDIDSKISNISSKISLFIFIFIVVYQSRDIKPIFLKPVNIFVKAYNTIGYYADILSYSRILALALASSAIAQTINLLVLKLFNAELLGIRYVEPILAPIVFIAGHLFNFVMSVLGGLVHSARLQYLEFFSKFFISGGRPIKLFAPIKNRS